MKFLLIKIWLFSNVCLGMVEDFPKTLGKIKEDVGVFVDYCSDYKSYLEDVVLQCKNGIKNLSNPKISISIREIYDQFQDLLMPHHYRIFFNNKYNEFKNKYKEIKAKYLRKYRKNLSNFNPEKMAMKEVLFALAMFYGQRIKDLDNVFFILENVANNISYNNLASAFVFLVANKNMHLLKNLYFELKDKSDIKMFALPLLYGNASEKREIKITNTEHDILLKIIRRIYPYVKNQRRIKKIMKFSPVLKYQIMDNNSALNIDEALADFHVFYKIVLKDLAKRHLKSSDVEFENFFLISNKRNLEKDESFLRMIGKPIDMRIDYFSDLDEPNENFLRVSLKEFYDMYKSKFELRFFEKEFPSDFFSYFRENQFPVEEKKIKKPRKKKKKLNNNLPEINLIDNFIPSEIIVDNDHNKEELNSRPLIVTYNPFKELKKRQQQYEDNKIDGIYLLNSQDYNIVSDVLDRTLSPGTKYGKIKHALNSLKISIESKGSGDFRKLILPNNKKQASFRPASNSIGHNLIKTLSKALEKMELTHDMIRLKGFDK